MAADHGRPTQEHPDPEVLLAYHERALSEEEADRVQEHLVRCAECAQVVLDFASFPDLEPPSEAHRVSPADLQRRWRDLQAAIAERKRPWWQRHEVLLPLAAGFFAAAVGLGLWGAGLERKVARLEGPRGDVQILASLRPVEEMSRGGEEVVRIEQEAAWQIIVLGLATRESDPHYRLRIEDASGRALTEDQEVRRSPNGSVPVVLPGQLLRPGHYRLELFGEEREGSEAVAEYRLLVEP